MSTNENKDKKAEVTALQAISAEDRKDWISLAFVQAGICVCVPAFLLGALLAEAMPNAYMASNYFRVTRLLNCSSRYGCNGNDRL